MTDTDQVVPAEPPVGTWVEDRHGGLTMRHRNGGWAPPGCEPLGQWAAMWGARGPLIVTGPWGSTDQTPATDSEPLRRDDWERRYRTANDEANSLAVRVVTAEDEAARLTALLAEQAATIREQVAQAREAVEMYQDERAKVQAVRDLRHDWFIALDNPEHTVLLEAVLDAVDAALGSQRTEGQG